MDEKKCENCYWKYLGNNDWCALSNIKPKENVCNNYRLKCKCGDEARYKYHGEIYCSDCILKEFGVTEYTVTNYYLDGEYIGNDDDKDAAIEGIDDDIEFIED